MSTGSQSDRSRRPERSAETRPRRAGQRRHIHRERDALPPVDCPTVGTHDNRCRGLDIVDGWVRDPSIRRDALIAFVLALIALVAVVCAVTGALGPLVRDAAGNDVFRVVAGGVLGGSGLAYGSLRILRRRSGRAERSADHKCALGEHSADTTVEDRPLGSK